MLYFWVLCARTVVKHIIIIVVKHIGLVNKRETYRETYRTCRAAMCKIHIEAYPFRHMCTMLPEDKARRA